MRQLLILEYLFIIKLTNRLINIHYYIINQFQQTTESVKNSKGGNGGLRGSGEGEERKPQVSIKSQTGVMAKKLKKGGVGMGS